MRVLLQKVVKTSLHNGKPFIPYLQIQPMKCPRRKRGNKEPMVLTYPRQRLTGLAGSAGNNYSESAILIPSSFPHEVISLLPYQVTVRRES